MRRDLTTGDKLSCDKIAMKIDTISCDKIAMKIDKIAISSDKIAGRESEIFAMTAMAAGGPCSPALFT